MEVRKLIRALISVYDKRGLADFAGGLAELGIEIISSGGTAQELTNNSIKVRQVSDLTGVNEALGGRLKTLHPLVHGGILADPNNSQHLTDLVTLGAETISLVVCNLYPFSSDPSVELIDIGGPAMIRAAAKNYENVAVVIDPDDYKKVLAELRQQFGGGAKNTVKDGGGVEGNRGDIGGSEGDFGSNEGDFGDNKEDNFETSEGDFESSEGDFGDNEGGFEGSEGDFESNKGDFGDNKEDNFEDKSARQIPPLSLETRKLLAAKAFRETAVYDRNISDWLGDDLSSTSSTSDLPATSPISDLPSTSDMPSTSSTSDLPATSAGLPSTTRLPSTSPTSDLPSISDLSPPSSLPAEKTFNLELAQSLRYGENPHQQGALYKIHGVPSFFDTLQQLNGKELSYLNIYDTAAAWLLVHQLATTKHASKKHPAKKHPAGAVIVKHANPCGAALAKNINDSFLRAHQCDPTSAFGGIVALSEEVSPALAENMAELFLEVVIAPAYNPDALEILRQKKNLRVLSASPPVSLELMSGVQMRSVENAVLLQTVDESQDGDSEDWQVVTPKKPSEKQWADLVFAEKVVAATSSNAIVIAKDLVALGIGAGQQNRRDAANIAAEKAGDRAEGGVYASDGFLPFADALDGAIQARCSAIVQPGGSVNDEKVIAAAKAAGLSMVFTGRRKFKH